MDNKIYTLLSGIVDKEQILIDEPMRNHTSFKIGGPADFLVLPKSVIEIQNIVKICKKENIPFFVIGNGTDLLVRDKGIRGVVLKIAKNFDHVKIIGEKVIAQAGISLSALAKVLLKNELTGFEFASGIPGTLGGAVTMNAGAYGGEIKDVLKNIEVMDQEGNIFILEGEEMKLEYRSSVVQEKNFIVLTATMQLQKGNYEEIKEKMRKLDQMRKTKQPIQWPSAGSTFKRPRGYFAGKLIQDAGLKGFSMGRAQVSDLHSGFVINKGGATAREVIELIGYIQATVKQKFGVDLHTEVKIVGEE
ncbi:UDP-N-acetylmuramate dehydrogenase [Garciella nitratireducens]|uniref:UDP-N-acetylenolpyruvoylglucosamine reductase n=1 Tax=Garciella nitratireducens DSM 15102 TaxID=1121911 RepID=A0A1T4NRA2_9FIRM|nr:UDP-N-acetylmuramate dehydrogenase [Garciella nitratireducens]SJZ81800.1 UDP-N-acetylmuramate dehydrogenase [Garciella nitratireducens DSM 15102]